MERINYRFTMRDIPFETRVLAIWPRIRQGSTFMTVPIIKGLYCWAAITAVQQDLDVDAEEVHVVVEFGDKLQANDEVRPTVWAFEAIWSLSAITATGVLLLTPQQSPWVPTDLMVPFLAQEADTVAMAGSGNIRVTVRTTVDYEWRTISRQSFAELLLSRGHDLRDFFELGKRLPISTPTAERNRGQD